MTTRGGRIPPDGRPPVNPGVGKNARRHDLEQPKTPGLHDSSLQYGDVQRLEQAQRIAGLPTTQSPSTGGAPSRSAPSPGGGSTGGGIVPPNPVEFAKQRFGGTLRGGATPRTEQMNIKPWLPLIRRIANSPGGSGVLRGAMLSQLSAMVNAPAVPQASVIDMDDLDRQLQGFADGL